MGIKISSLPSIVIPEMTDVFPVSQNGVTYKETITQLFELIVSNGTILITGRPISTVPSIAFSSTSGVIGTTTNDNAASGSVGEFVSSVIPNASAVSVTSTVNDNLTSISLSPGDWNIFGNAYFSTTISATQFGCWISDTSASFSDISIINNLSATFTQMGLSAPQLRFSLDSTTTIYLGCTATFSGTGTVRGGLYARRVR